MTEIYFSQIKEDSWVEKDLLSTHPSRRIVAIGSGGCTAFSLLVDDVERLYAVDANPAQCALIDLKKAAIRALCREDYLSFVGEGDRIDRMEVYRRLVADLPSYAAAFWNRHPGRIIKGINYSGMTERFYRFIGDNLRLNVCSPGALQELLGCDDVNEQRALYARSVRTESWLLALRLMFSRTSHVPFYPGFWFTGREETMFSDFFIERFEHEIETRPLRGNYFFSQLMFGTFVFDEPRGVPPYMSAEHYDVTRRNIDKLTVENKPLQHLMMGLDEIDGFYFSNVFDWGKDKDAADVCRGILHCKAQGTARFFFRNMYRPTSLPDFFAERFDRNEEQSLISFAKERSMLYRHATTGTIN
ncbi:DUF3419 family protein [Hoeflea marina]|uniref:DUF3419 family protein n=1 Tax=Hoeflea marina TaxID=274592 RepID=UPI001304FD04|nr:DUF3419 family protein [Hoeflea marina]